MCRGGGLTCVPPVFSGIQQREREGRTERGEHSFEVAFGDDAVVVLIYHLEGVTTNNIHNKGSVGSLEVGGAGQVGLTAKASLNVCSMPVSCAMGGGGRD